MLVAALAGAVSTYLQEHDGDAVDLPTMVPVNLRAPDEPPPRELGNKFALVLLSLPSGRETPFARLAETKRRMDEIKHSPEAVLTFGLIRRRSAAPAVRWSVTSSTSSPTRRAA